MVNERAVAIKDDDGKVRWQPQRVNGERQVWSNPNGQGYTRFWQHPDESFQHGLPLTYRSRSRALRNADDAWRKRFWILAAVGYVCVVAVSVVLLGFVFGW